MGVVAERERQHRSFVIH